MTHSGECACHTRAMAFAQRLTILAAIARTERMLLHDLDPRDRADEEERLELLRALLRQTR